jgi:hypothetical protein
VLLIGFSIIEPGLRGDLSAVLVDRYWLTSQKLTGRSLLGYQNLFNRFLRGDLVDSDQYRFVGETWAQWKLTRPKTLSLDEASFDQDLLAALSKGGRCWEAICCMK